MKVAICVVHYGDDSKLMCMTDVESADPHVFYSMVHNNNVENIGFTAGNNRLISKFRDADWIWLLNNDTKVPSDTFDAIVRQLDMMPKDIGVIGFKILSMDNPDLIHHGGTSSAFPAGVHKSGSVKLHQLQKRTYEKWVTFASVLIRKQVIDKIGLLDEGMIHIGSDSDFCYRARAAGFNVIYEPSFMIYHQIGTSQNPTSPIARQMQADMIYFQNKWLNGKLWYDLDNELLPE